MHINELTITNQLKDVGPWDHAGSLKKILTRHGWKSLGTGAEAAVAMHPQKAYVLKIFNSDSKYVQFVEFVQAHQSNPHLPRFSRYVRPVPGTEFSYVRMEKLMKVTHTQLLTTYAAYLAEMMAMGQVAEFSMLADDLGMRMEDNLMHMGYEAADLLDFEQQDEIYQKLGGQPPHTWSQVLGDLADYSEHVDVASWDMHEDNFMRRGKTLVIVDPFYG
jgi:hypothetical protein